ncbi:MAG: OB-fold domain-containing protein, partial [Pseudomonadota bacterium]|nr:OB-fold domain-containing protein [Pseudomonadota bacterium]
MVIDVGGVGYLVFVSARTADRLGPVGGAVISPLAPDSLWRSRAWRVSRVSTRSGPLRRGLGAPDVCRIRA